MEFVGFGLKQAPYAINNYDKVYYPVKRRVKKMRGRDQQVYDESITDTKTFEEKGLVLRKRSEVQSDEEIVEVVRHRGERLPRRPGMPRQTSSMTDLRGAGGQNGQMTKYRGGAAGAGGASDSEGSVPPKSRNRGRAKSASGRSDKKGSKDSSESSSDLGSSSGDEKECKKMMRKKWITAGLAGVATIHAASNLYSSVEKHDKRMEEVIKGTLSPEDAHKKQRQARWQDAASLAIAALGIKGAISEWHEVQESQHEHKELLEHRTERHKKRLERERRKKAREQGGYYKGRDGQWYHDHPSERQGHNSSRSEKGGRQPAALSAVEDY